MKKLRLLLCLLIVVCIIASSSITFSAMPQGKFPIQILSARPTPNNYEKEIITYLNRAFNNSTSYRISNNEENRIMLRILINRYYPGVVSTDVFATSNPINTFTLVWLAKPKNKHAFYIWSDSGKFQSYEELTRYIIEETDTMVWTIKNQCPYVFD